MSDEAEGDEKSRENAEQTGEDEKADWRSPSLFAGVVERVADWLEPIDGGAGEDAKLEPAYEQVRDEVAKLDSVHSDEVEWETVFAAGRDILRHQAKDLLIAGYAAYAMYEIQGLEGLVNGMAMFTAMTNEYWENGFPPTTRIRGRVGALVWYLDQIKLVLPGLEVGAGDRRLLEEMRAVTKELEEVVRERFAHKAPPIGPLAAHIERLLLNIPDEDEEPAEPEPPDDDEQREAEEEAASGDEGASVVEVGAVTEPVAVEESIAVTEAIAGPPLPVATPSAPAGGQTGAADLPGFLRDIGGRMLAVGKDLRTEQPMSATAWVLLRLGTWLEVAEPPPIQPDGRTRVPPLGEELRERLQRLAESNDWAKLLDEAESAMFDNPLQIDLYRHSAKAMASLGGAYGSVLKISKALLAMLLARVPALPRMVCEDGSLLCDHQTREWLNEEVLGTGGSTGSAKPVVPAREAAEAKKLVGAGKIAEAIKVYDKVAAQAPDERTRFRVRLANGQMCCQGGHTEVAEAIFSTLYQEAIDLGIERWEPDLVVECLVGGLACLRSNREKGRATPAELELYRKLAGLRPAMAVELGAW